MSQIRKNDIIRNKAFNLFFSFIMNKISEYDTKQILQELSLGRLNFKELLIRETKKNIVPFGEAGQKSYNRRNNLYKERMESSEYNRNIDLMAYIFSNIRGFLEYQYIRRLTHDDIKNMCRFIQYEFYPKGSYIFRQGDRSDYFYGIIDGEVQVIETRFTDRLKNLKDLMIKIDENEKISEEEKIFFLNKNRNNPIKKDDDKNKNFEDDISIETKSYFVSNKDGDDNLEQKDYNLIDLEDYSIDSLSENNNIIENNKTIKRNNTYNFVVNYISNEKPNKNDKKNITKLNLYKKINIKNCKTYSDKNLNKKGLAIHLAYKSIKKKRKKEKDKLNQNKVIIISDEERINIEFLNKNLMLFGKILKEGNCFGDQEMCKKGKRNYSVICTQNSHLFSLKKEYFDKYMKGKIIRSELLKSKFILDKLPVIQKEQHFFSLISRVIPLLYKKEEILFTPFDITDYLYIVYKGECALCETYKKYNSKKDFLFEKPEMKIYSILNEGGIGGLEAFQKGSNYERYMVVNSSFTIILKLDIKDFEENTHRFRRSLEPLYYQQQRMFFSIQRKGILFKIGREINENEKEKIKFKNYIKNSVSLKDKNKFDIKYKLTFKEKDKDKKNTFKNIISNESNITQSNYNNTIRNLNSFNTKNSIQSKNFRTLTESKIYSPIKILIRQKNNELEDTNNILSNYIKENFHSINNNSRNRTINSNLKYSKENTEDNNKCFSQNSIFKQKKNHCFYHKKFGKNPISLKNYFSQKDQNLILKKNMFFNNKNSLNNNIFNYYKKIGDDLNSNERENKFSNDKVVILSENSLPEKENKKKNILNIKSTIKTKKSLNLKILKRNTNLFSVSKIKKAKTKDYSNNKMKLPFLLNNH